MCDTAVYPASKLLVHALAVLLACKALYDGVHLIHPGIVTTTLYQAEAGVIGRLLRSFFRRVAWDAETSASRFLHMLWRAGVFDNTICTTAMYWDASSLKPRVLTSELSNHLAVELEVQLRRPRSPTVNTYNPSSGNVHGSGGKNEERKGANEADRIVLPRCGEHQTWRKESEHETR